MDPETYLELLAASLFVASFFSGLIWGYIFGRNAKIAGVINIEPIQRLPADEPPGREVP